MFIFLARCVACTLFFCLPILVIVAMASDPAVGLLMLLPMAGLIPAYVIALILFVPVEAAMDRIGMPWLANLMVPVTGVLGAILCFVALGLYWGELDIVIRNFRRDPWAFGFWLGLGAVWGILWRLTALVRLLPIVARRVKPA